MSYISRWLLLVSVILQISNSEAILYSGHLFDTPCITFLTKSFATQTNGHKQPSKSLEMSNFPLSF